MTELVILALNDVYPSLSVESKDSVSLKKALAGDGDWDQIKEILGWIVNNRHSILNLSKKRMTDLNT